MDQLESIVFGQSVAVRQVVTALLAGGHVLLQGVPGVGKTRLARAITHLVGGTFRRIQFTPDLLPSDVVGNAVFNLRDGTFEVHPGPVFANVVLADEVNRTPPKTQAALLEAMEERQVSLFGETRSLPEPFFVIATQNPVEYEGTYALPEAQLDRFLMEVNMGYPDLDGEVEMLRRHRSGTGPYLARLSPVLTLTELSGMLREVQNVTAAPEVLLYIARLVRATRELRGVALGASPRAATALLDAARANAYLEGRDYLVPDDVIQVAKPVLRHRLALDAGAELEGIRADDVVDQVVEQVDVPR
ncbi:MAG: MoxR family ATPase [Alicyclobacillaceae bacterium]|nr:MoxR family ATPase [Alicyclobacillaceae bacterium]